MSPTVQQILESFDSLAASEKRQVTLELLRRSAEVSSDLSNDDLTTLAEELFLNLDLQEGDDCGTTEVAPR